MIIGVRAPNAAPFSRKFITVIAGINTDVEFNGTVYHVQTEDKGAPARQIMSLVYNKGTILASKRVSYDDLESVNFSEKQIATRVSRQHKLICAAVRAGRIDELKEMATQKGVSSVKSSAPQAVVAEAVLPVNAAPVSAATMESVPMVIPQPDDLFADGLVIDPVGIIEDEILPADAVAVVSELAGRERRTHNKLTLELLGEPKFKGGDRKTVNIMICRGSARKVVAGAEIMIKVVGSSFRPVIFHAQSDPNGLAKMHIEVPQFQTGRAALLLRVLNDGEEVELRRVVTAG